MSNPFDEIRAAVSQARDLNRAVEGQANALADLLEPHITNVSHNRLKRLKRLLESYNAHTNRWRHKSRPIHKANSA